jgi:hypothetical protein
LNYRAGPVASAGSVFHDQKRVRPISMSTQEERARRIGLNEALFRRVNEEIERAFETDETETDRLSILCECGDLDCTSQVPITPGRYHEVRKNPLLFIVTPGHEIPDVETVVEREADFEIVSKDSGTPEKIARSTASN